jgi:hypothetical protein
MSVKIFLMWNSALLIDGGDDAMLATSLLEASNLIVLKVCATVRLFGIFLKYIAYHAFIDDVSAFSITGVVCHTF